ncbi:solute carrier family 22 member 5 [Aplysia californica]|uniref:Solute carrier family 22 member 5 n=1 Tax=Aplysia californica TaxID=6500 RepID=A0ABM0JBH6_APLCA|nr:solute carrier family 22 member 5 [Aplysia californica]
MLCYFSVSGSLRLSMIMDGKLDKFISEVGGCGMFQVLLSLAVYTIKVVGAWGMLFMSFGSYNPGWTCMDLKVNDTVTALSEPPYLNSTTLGILGPNSSVSTYNMSMSEQEKCQEAQSCQDVRFDPDSATIVSEWYLICDRSWLAPITISIQMVGVTIGSFIAGQLAERFGRKLSMYLWVVLGVVSNVVALFSPNWEVYTAVRFVIGMSVGGNLSTCQVYALEFVTAKWRVFLTGLPTWNVGSISFGICVFLLKDWRDAHVATAVLGAFAFLSVFWVPESLRWLVVQGKVKETKKVANMFCRVNGRSEPDPHLTAFTNCEGQQDDKKVAIRQLFRSDLRKKTIVCSAIYFFMAIMYYSIGFGIKALYGDFYINFILYTVFPLPLAPLAPVLGHKLGRRWGSTVLMFSCGLVSSSVIVVFFTTSGQVQGYVITGLALATSALLDYAWSILTAFIAELFPTPVRLLSFGFIFSAARFGSILSPFLIPRDFSILYISYLVMGILAIINCCLILSMPETKDLGLEDTLHARSQLEVEMTQGDITKPTRENSPLS